VFYGRPPKSGCSGRFRSSIQNFSADYEDRLRFLRTATTKSRHPIRRACTKTRSQKQPSAPFRHTSLPLRHWFKADSCTYLLPHETLPFGPAALLRLANAALLQAQPAASRLINISCRAQAGAGENILIGGFVVGGLRQQNGFDPRIGPGLTQLECPGRCRILR